MNEKCDNWDGLIPGVLFAYHTSVHSSTKYTPFEVMYGRKAILLLDLHPVSDIEPNVDTLDTAFIDTMTQMHVSIKDNVAENITSAKSSLKKHYDRHHQSHKDINIGAKVYIKNSRRIHRMGSKLEPMYIGPYEVVESLDKGRVRVKNIKTSQKLKILYHSYSLKIYDNTEMREQTDSASPSKKRPSDPTSERDAKQNKMAQPPSPSRKPPYPESSKSNEPLLSPRLSSMSVPLEANWSTSQLLDLSHPASSPPEMSHPTSSPPEISHTTSPPPPS